METTEKKSLKIIPIGGTTTVQKNMYVYECGQDIIILDCGIGFPDIETPGVDIVIPDFTYILENRDKVRGVVITHGHEDHRSSLPFLLREHKFDVYATSFVKALIEKSLEEYTDIANFKVQVLDPDKSLQLGCFTLHPFRVNHSIPDTLGFAIDTPQGRIFHNTDYKFDWSPVMDKPFDIQKAANLASEPNSGVLALLSDCLGSTSEGYSTTEKQIQSTFEEILNKSKGRQVLITTISSNISRIQQAIEASLKYGRKVVISGKSLRNTIEVSKELGYINFPEDVFIDDRKSNSYEQDKLTYIITGCYGQKNSGLMRAAFNDSKYVNLTDNPVIIFSADPIPNVLSAVNLLIDQLYRQGAEVYYSEIQDNLHVSGHGSKGDLTLLANVVKPKYYIPIGGNIKHMRAYSKMIQKLGVSKNRILQLLDGQTIVFENGKVHFGKKLKLKEVFVDGNLVGDVGNAVIQDRLQMASHGMVVVVIRGDRVEIVTRGFVFVKQSKHLIKQAEKVVMNVLKTTSQDHKHSNKLKLKIEDKLGRFLYSETGRKPLILVSELVNQPKH